MMTTVLRRLTPGVRRLQRRFQSSGAKAKFGSALKHLLDRPLPDSFSCRCCGATNVLAAADQISAACVFSGLALTRFRCGSCGVIFGPIPLVTCHAKELAALYELLYSFYAEGFSQPYQEKTFYLLNPSRRGRYLNYACGDWSVGIEHLTSLGWNVTGFEPFQTVHSASIVTDRARLHGEGYDGLYTHNFLEHVQDPMQFLRECSELIAPGGKMAHSSACFDYVFEVSPFHLFFYCGDSVRHLAHRTGFQLLAEHRVDQDLPGYEYVCCLFQKTRSVMGV